jgi:hypothetical protein
LGVADKTAGEVPNPLDAAPLDLAKPPARGRPFAPGKSGNPAGRPLGAKNKTTQFLESLVEGAGESVIAKLVQQAKEGKPLALRLVVDRLLPLREERRVQIADLRRLVTACDLVHASAEVISLAASGQMSIEEAQGFLRLVEYQRKIIEGADLAVKVVALEAELAAEKDRTTKRRKGGGRG